MKSNSLLLALMMVGGLFSTASYAAATGTGSSAIIFLFKLISGTCNFEVQDGIDAATSTAGIGNIYKNDIRTDAVKKLSYIAFKKCAGVSDIYITARTTGDTCDSTSYSTNDAMSTNTSIQIHREEYSSQKTPHPLNCAMTPTGGGDTIHHGFGVSRLNISVAFDMYTTLMLTNGRAASDIGVDTVTAPVTSSISYE